MYKQIAAIRHKPYLYYKFNKLHATYVIIYILSDYTP